MKQVINFNNKNWPLPEPAPSGPPSDEIWYTSSNGNTVAPYQASSLPTIVSNTYVDGKGIIKFATDITSIGNSAFNMCTGLTSIEIPNSVTSIGTGAFYMCTGLTSVTIPNSVTSIGDAAFTGCTGLTSINVASDNPNYCSVNGALFNKNRTTLISYPGGKQGAYTIPNSVTSIGKDAFYNCTGLTSVTIGNGVSSIGDGAFNYCTGLTSVTIPNSVTSIGKDAFGQISAKILFSKLYSTYTNKIFLTPSSSTGITCNVEFNISEIPTGYNISSMLPQGPSQSNKGSITYNIYTDYTPCKDQALALANAKTIVNVYHIDGTPWE